MSVKIIPSDRFRGQLVGAIDTPEKVIAQAHLKRLAAAGVVNQLMALDDKPQDMARGKGTVSLVQRLVGPQSPGDYDLFVRAENNALPPGYESFGEVGVVLTYDPVKRSPIELRIEDALGRLSFRAKYQDGEVVEATHTVASVKYRDNPDARSRVTLTTNGAVKTVTFDSYTAKSE